MIIAEGAQDSELNHIASSTVKDVLSTRLGLDTRVTVLGHIQRGGTPCFYDRWLATMQGIKAVQAVLDMTPDTPSPVVTIQEDKIALSNLSETVAGTKKVNIHMQAKDFQAAMQLRDPEFLEYHKAYRHLNAADYRKMIVPEEKVSHLTRGPSSRG